MNRAAMAAGFVIIVLIFLLSGSFFTVNMTEQAVVTRFGKPIRTIKEPGLKLKAPFVDKLIRFDKRILEWDGSPDQIPTKDKKFIWVDTYARWRIGDPLQFYKRVHSERGAQARLDDIIDSTARNYISDNNLIELVRDSNRPFAVDVEDVVARQVPTIEEGRRHITRAIWEDARQRMPEYGIDLIDFQIKRINYVEEVRRRVYERMTSERKRIAELYRAQGKEAREEIEGKKLKLLNKIESEAYEKSQSIRGEADAESTRIYAEAYRRDPAFYMFTRSLENYRTAFSADTTFVLSTDNAFLKHLKAPEPR